MCILQDQGVCFKNANELLNPRALTFSTLYINGIFQCIVNIFCVEFQRVPFEIPHKISYPYIERCFFYLIWIFNSSWVLELVRFLNVPSTKIWQYFPAAGPALCHNLHVIARVQPVHHQQFIQMWRIIHGIANQVIVIKIVWTTYRLKLKCNHVDELSSMTAPKVVKMITYGATSYKNFVKITIFTVQYNKALMPWF